MPMPMGVHQKSPKQSDVKKLRVIDENQSLDVTNTKVPDINLLVSFIEEAGELADGHRQTSMMDEIVAQFGEYLLYVDNLEAKVKNLKSAHAALLERQRGMVLY